MKIIGYGICGPGEAGRYMRETLDEFKRLCDEVIILVNSNGGAGHAEIALIKEYGFRYVLDGREWGKLQWLIKQDFIEQHVSKIAEQGDMMICLDMDETLDRELTREWIFAAPLDAYHVFVVDLWNDRQHYKPESCFWNVRMWRWNGNTEWLQKPVHCGLAPKWAYHYNRYAPFLLLHKGLMDPKDRARKIERYEKYDPDAKHLDRRYYKMLAEDTASVFDEASLHAKIASEVATYQQPKPREQQRFMAKNREQYHYVRNAAGQTVDVPERHLQETLKRPGFTYVGKCDDVAKEMEELFADVDVPEQEAATGHVVGADSGSYQRSQADEAAEVAALNAKDNPAAPSLEELGEPSESRIPRVAFAEDKRKPGEECVTPEGKPGVLAQADAGAELICVPITAAPVGQSRTGINQQTTGRRRSAKSS